jgi:hypothetical protein
MYKLVLARRVKGQKMFARVPNQLEKVVPPASKDMDRLTRNSQAKLTQSLSHHLRLDTTRQIHRLLLISLLRYSHTCHLSTLHIPNSMYNGANSPAPVGWVFIQPKTPQCQRSRHSNELHSTRPNLP